MALSDLVAKIKSDAALEKERILNAARETASAMEVDFAREKEALTEQYTKDLTRTLEENERRVTSSAEKEAKLYVNETKRALSEEVFNAVLKDFAGMSDDDYKSFILPYLKELPEEKGGALRTSPKRAAVTRKALKEAGKKAHVEEDKHVADGFVYSGESFEYTVNPADILAQKRGELEVEIAHILFG